MLLPEEDTDPDTEGVEEEDENGDEDHDYGGEGDDEEDGQETEHAKDEMRECGRRI